MMHFRGLKRIAFAGLSMVILISGCATTRNFNSEKPIEVVEASLGTNYRQNGETLDPDAMLEALLVTAKHSSELKGTPALEEIRNQAESAQNLRNTSAVLSTIGGLLIGVPLGTGLAGERPSWNLAYAGVAFVSAGIVLGVMGSGHVKKAVEKYNESFKAKLKASAWIAPTDLNATPAFQAGLSFQL